MPVADGPPQRRSTSAGGEGTPLKKRLTSRDIQREATRQRIIQSALRVFAENGFGGAGTRAIAAGAGVRQALLAHYFKSKEDLWKAAVSSLFEILDDRLEASGSNDDGLSVRERLRKRFEVYIRFSAEHPEHGRLMQHAGMLGGPMLQWLADTHLRRRFLLSIEIIEDAIGEGSLPDTDPLLLHYMLNGVSQSIYLLEAEARQLTGIDVRKRAVVERHIEAVLRVFGLETKPTEPVRLNGVDQLAE